ncbi:MAG: hypothetical protein GKR88_03995 [Flavobacteriaceae bacterium]|nr:MAG: hypothetical protein GKR88_03995 [Flavobacteriaceae bacterium]
MKKIFFVLAFTLVGTFAFANNSVEREAKIEIENITEMSNSLEFLDSCTIRQAQQVISNGEVVYEYYTVFHIDGYSCEQFFSMIIAAFW